MGLTTTEQIILIILAAALAVFIILGIAVLILVLRLLSTLKLMADKAEKIIESAEAVGQVIKNVAAPAGLLKVFHTIMETVVKQRKDKE